jgi:nitrile hydratase accessory protein
MSAAPAPSQFDDPWQAQIFALTVALSDAGHFSWHDWTVAFGATLKRHGRSGRWTAGRTISMRGWRHSRRS